MIFLLARHNHNDTVSKCTIFTQNTGQMRFFLKKTVFLFKFILLLTDIYVILQTIYI